ncbi:unnamed protein product, partial [Tetraodon nigroviridis]
METTTRTVGGPVGLGSAAQWAGLAEMAARLFLNQRKQLCPHVWVPILKPRRPCIRLPVPEVSPPDLRTAAPLSRPAPLILDEPDEDEILLPLRNKRSLGSMTEDGYSCTVSTCCPGTRLRLGFPQPSADFQAFRERLARSMVTLESCSLDGHVLRGTVRVRNLSFQKDVRARVTFDSWLSYQDVACAYLQKRFGGPDTDIFQFHVAVPKVLDAKRKIEFCLFYLPGGHTEPFWDNNGNGQKLHAVAVC